MADRFWNSGEKATAKEAEKALRQHTAGVCDNRFSVQFRSDDGGNHITLYLEVEDPDPPLEPWLREALNFPKWMGWRMIIMKCPIGYISAFIDTPKRR
jgi:hypothetical protein